MTQTIEIDNLHCRCCKSPGSSKIAYILYPMDTLAGWIAPAAEKYGVNIVVITGMDWENVFSLWPAPGVPKGSPDFKGGSPVFLTLLQQTVLPQIEQSLDLDVNLERTLVGVSMSGLFALWQWIICDTFTNIASLSGSFWYDGFIEWMKSHPIPSKKGKGYFLLGRQESKSGIKAFNSVGENTALIIKLLKAAGINVDFQSVPGNHYSDPIPRLEKAFDSIYSV